MDYCNLKCLSGHYYSLLKIALLLNVSFILYVMLGLGLGLGLGSEG